AEAKEILEKVPGAVEVEFEPSGRIPMLEAQINRSALVKYSLHAEEVNKAISTALGGRTVGTLVEGNRRFDLVVRMPESLRENIEQISELPVRVGEHGMLPLAKVAGLKLTDSVVRMRR